MTTTQGPRERVQRFVSSPYAWHYTSLIVGFAVIAWLQRSQWFFFDEWAFLEPTSPGLLAPHVGHWSTSPLLLFHGFRDWFGLDSYFPFAMAVTVAHLAVAHVIWRIVRRAGADPWIATAGVSVLIVLGTGSENILWAFQVGFLGGLALGLTSFLLALQDDWSRRRFVGAILVSLFALTWSGTAIPLVVASAAVWWRKRGFRTAAVYSAIAGGVYLTWYAAFALGNPNNPDTGGWGAEKLLVKVPEFVGVMLIYGFQDIFPVFGIGAIVLVALLAWLVVLRVRRASVPGLSTALILTAAAVLFSLLTAFSRASFSIGGGRSSRYVYVLVVLLLPLACVALTRAAARVRLGRTAVVALLLVLGGYQGHLLLVHASAEAEREAGSDRVLSAALSLYLEDPSQVDLAAQPEGVWAPDLVLADLVDLYTSGRFPIDPFTPEDLAQARENVGVSP